MPKRHPRPQHNNTYAFKHNKNSKKTKKILSLPITGLCKHCHDKIEWRKQFRKYKPLSTPKRCESCQKKEVRHAYHIICQPCARKRKKCAGCLKQTNIIEDQKEKKQKEANLEDKLSEHLSSLKERDRRRVIRQYQRGELELIENEDEDKDEDTKIGE